MQSFEDAKGRSWTILVEPIGVDAIKAEHGVDLFEVDIARTHADPADSVEARLKGNPLLLCRVLWGLRYEPPDDIAFEDFARALYGDTLQAATDALWDEIVNFTPDPQARQVRRAMQAKLRETEHAALRRLHGLIESPGTDATLENELRKLDGMFSNLLDEWASTLDTTPSPPST